MTDATTPEFGGKCAFATALGGPAKAPMGKSKYTITKDGKTYLFSGAVPMWLWKTFKLQARSDAKGAAS